MSRFTTKHRKRLRQIAEEWGAAGVHGGVPLPVHGLSMTFSPRVKTAMTDHYEGTFSAPQQRFVRETPSPVPQADGCGVTYEFEYGDEVARFICQRRHVGVKVYRGQESGTYWHHTEELDTARQRVDIMFKSAIALSGIDPKAERIAQRRLRALLTKYQWETWQMTRMFHEDSTKSGIGYTFRWQRPILVVSLRPANPHRDLLCFLRRTFPYIGTLCSHPFGYYQGTFQGFKCPTDDVIYQLTTMRADEHFLWRKAYFHPLHQVESGF